jgi:hypothetical protein
VLMPDKADEPIQWGSVLIGLATVVAVVWLVARLAGVDTSGAGRYLLGLLVLVALGSLYRRGREVGIRDRVRIEEEERRKIRE